MGSMIRKEINYNLHYDDLRGDSIVPTDFKSNGPVVQEKMQKYAGHLWFPIETILALFDLQVTPKLLTTFRVNLSMGVVGVGL